MVLPQTPDTDPRFVTNGDYLWAKYIAYERLQHWQEAELGKLRGGSDDEDKAPPNHPGGGPGGLRWTGETINLVELAYGIWLMGQLNNGQVAVTEIVEFIEQVFRVHIGKPHRQARDSEQKTAGVYQVSG